MRTAARILAGAVVVAVVAFVLILLAAAFVEGMLGAAALLGLQHALGMDTQTSHNYAAVSGVLPMIVAAFGFSGALIGIWRHINCEVPGCPRPGHTHPEHGRPVCRRHYHHDVAPPAP